MESEKQEGGQFGLRTGVPLSGVRQFWKDIALVALAGLFARVLFLAFCGPHLVGSGLAYTQAATDVLGGMHGDRWLGSFGLWQTAIQLIIRDPLWSGVVASLLPGIVLVPLSHLLALTLSGRAVGYFTGLFSACHPLLISYSCNGFEHSFLCLWVTLGLLMLCQLFKGEGRGATVWIGGLSLGIAAATRNEFLPFALLAGLFVGIAAPTPLSIRLRQGGIVGATATLLFLGFQLIPQKFHPIDSSNQATTADVYKPPMDSGLLPIPAVLRSSAFLNENGPSAQGPYGLRQRLSNLLHSLRQNISSGLPRSAIRLSASPLPILTTIVMFGWLLGREWRREFLPLALLLISLPVILLTFPLEPRHLMPLLVAMHTLASMGIVRFIYSKKMHLGVRWGALVAVPLCLAILCIGSLWKGAGSRAQRDLHRLVAETLRENVPRGAVVTGCGKGYINASTFLSGHHPQERIRTQDPLALFGFMESSQSEWLVLYEQYISQHDPPFLPFLQEPITGFERVKELRSQRGDLILLLKRNTASSVGAGASPN